MASHHDYGIDCEAFCGGTPDDEDSRPGPPADLTCTHAECGLCDACRADYDEDPGAWLEYGDHPEGLANWKALQAELNNEWAAEPQPPTDMDDTGIPF